MAGPAGPQLYRHIRRSNLWLGHRARALAKIQDIGRMLCRRGLVEAKTSAWGAKTGVSAASCRAAGVRVVAAINTAKAND